MNVRESAAIHEGLSKRVLLLNECSEQLMKKFLEKIEGSFGRFSVAVVARVSERLRENIFQNNPRMDL